MKKLFSLLIVGIVIFTFGNIANASGSINFNYELTPTSSSNTPTFVYSDSFSASGTLYDIAYITQCNADISGYGWVPVVLQRLDNESGSWIDVSTNYIKRNGSNISGWESEPSQPFVTNATYRLKQLNDSVDNPLSCTGHINYSDY